MPNFEYLDIPLEEGRLKCDSLKLHPEMNARLNAMYKLSYLLDGFDEGFKSTPALALRTYLTTVQVNPGRFNYPPDDIVLAAQNALKVAAFDAAQKCVIWPRLRCVPRKTYYSHPWEHRHKGEPLDYSRGRVDPTGTTLYFGFLDHKNPPPRLSAQRLYEAGERQQLAYSAEEIDPASYGEGCAILRNIFEIRRSHDPAILEYYFAHREELKDFVNQRIYGRHGSIHTWQDFNILVDLRRKMSKDLKDPNSDFAKQFLFPVPFTVLDRSDPNDSQMEKDIMALREVSEPELDHLLIRLHLFALIDLALSPEVTDLTLGNISQFQLTHYGEFHACWNAYGDYLNGAFNVRAGLVEARECGPRRLHGFEAYFLVIHSLLFESDDLMRKNGTHTDEMDQEHHNGGARYVFIEDFGKRMMQMGIDFRYVEDVVIALDDYFQSLGLFLVRNSGSREITDKTVGVNERIRDVFDHLDDRDMLRMRLLAVIPYNGLGT